MLLYQCGILSEPLTHTLYKGHNMTTHKLLTASAIRDDKGRFTGMYSFGLNWGAIVDNGTRRIPRVWCALQLAVLAIVASQMGAY